MEIQGKVNSSSPTPFSLKLQHAKKGRLQCASSDSMLSRRYCVLGPSIIRKSADVDDSAHLVAKPHGSLVMFSIAMLPPDQVGVHDATVCLPVSLFWCILPSVITASFNHSTPEMSAVFRESGVWHAGAFEFCLVSTRSSCQVFVR